MPGPGEADVSSYKPLQFINPLQMMGQMQELQIQQQNLAAQRAKAFAAAGYALQEQHGANPQGMTHKDVANALNNLIATNLLPPKAAAEMMARLQKVPQAQLYGQVKLFTDSMLQTSEAAAIEAGRHGTQNIGGVVQPTYRGPGQAIDLGAGAGQPVRQTLSPGEAIQPQTIVGPDGAERKVPTGEAFGGNPVTRPGGGAVGPGAKRPTLGTVAQDSGVLRASDGGAKVQSGEVKPFGNPGGPASGKAVGASGGLETKPGTVTLKRLEDNAEYTTRVPKENEAAAAAIQAVDHIQRDLLPNAIQGPGSTARLGIIRLGAALGLDQAALERIVPQETGKKAADTEALRKAYAQLATDYLRQAFPTDREISNQQLALSALVNPNIDMTRDGAKIIVKYIGDIAKLKMAENIALNNALKQGMDLNEFRTAWTTRQRGRIYEKIAKGEYDPTAGGGQ